MTTQPDTSASLDAAKRSNLMKLEAVGLFVQVKALIEGQRWHFFREARRQAYPIGLHQSISAYRASLHFAYVLQPRPLALMSEPHAAPEAVTADVYLERESQARRADQAGWHLSFTSIEGKAQAMLLADVLRPLTKRDYYMPDWSDNLERQMNFSLGLMGDCLTHVDLLFPSERPALDCVVEVLDLLEDTDAKTPLDLWQIRQASGANSSQDDDDLVIMGDWQTWK